MAGCSLQCSVEGKQGYYHQGKPNLVKTSQTTAQTDPLAEVRTERFDPLYQPGRDISKDEKAPVEAAGWSVGMPVNEGAWWRGGRTAGYWDSKRGTRRFLRGRKNVTKKIKSVNFHKNVPSLFHAPTFISHLFKFGLRVQVWWPLWWPGWYVL